jgi:hypothetical protein
MRWSPVPHDIIQSSMLPALDMCGALSIGGMRMMSSAAAGATCCCAAQSCMSRHGALNKPLLLSYCVCPVCAL